MWSHIARPKTSCTHAHCTHFSEWISLAHAQVWPQIARVRTHLRNPCYLVYLPVSTLYDHNPHTIVFNPFLVNILIFRPLYLCTCSTKRRICTSYAHKQPHFHSLNLILFVHQTILKLNNWSWENCMIGNPLNPLNRLVLWLTAINNRFNQSHIRQFQCT